MPQDLLEAYPDLFSLENSLAIAYHSRSVAYHRRGVAYRSLGQYDKADADLDQACSFGQPSYRWATMRQELLKRLIYSQYSM